MNVYSIRQLTFQSVCPRPRVAVCSHVTSRFCLLLMMTLSLSVCKVGFHVGEWPALCASLNRALWENEEGGGEKQERSGRSDGREEAEPVTVRKKTKRKVTAAERIFQVSFLLEYIFVLNFKGPGKDELHPCLTQVSHKT